MSRSYANFGRLSASSSGSVPESANCRTTPSSVYGFGGQPGRLTIILFGRRSASPTGAGADGDDSRSPARDVGENVHGWPPGKFHVNALIPGGDRALDHADVFTGVFVHGLRERFLGLPARTRH